MFVHRTELPAEVNFLYASQALTFDIDRTSRGLRAADIAVVAAE